MRAAAAVLGLLTALVCSGCGFKGTLAVDAGPPPDDAPIDASDDASDDGPPDACATISRQLNTCGLPLGTDLSIAQAATYNTDTKELKVGGLLTGTMSAMVIVNGQTVDAILVRDLTIASGVTLRAAGDQPTDSPPLVIIAGGTVTLEDGASIDVSAGGAGVEMTCATPPANGQNSTTDGGGGGGGGGSYGGGGGDGGNGNLGGTVMLGGRGGGSVNMTSLVQGGCPGARGGVGTGGHFGAPGRGGGAMLIIAGGDITLGSDAVLQAGGGGGGGAGRSETPNTGEGGGGGGEGSSLTQAGNNGTPGSTSLVPAPGGGGGATDGTDGGAGGASATTGGVTVTAVQTGGGGGGGGGVGYIHVLSPDARLGVNVSPVPRIEP